MAFAEVRRFLDDLLQFVERILEAQRLPTMVRPLLEMGVSPLDRITQDRDDAHVRKVPGQPLRRERMKQVVGACLATDRGPDERLDSPPTGDLNREVGTVPSQAARVPGVVIVCALNVLTTRE